jgi:hypothetical protein
MNRHHPYGGGYESPSAPRRGGPPTGPGPDRHRFSQDRGGGPGRGRGFGRGRGGAGYGNYDANANYSSYDQGIPQGDQSSYSYDNGPAQTQTPFYQAPSYSATSAPLTQYGISAPSDAFSQGNQDQGYGNFEGALES